MAQDNILDNIAVNDLNLDMTNEDISTLNNLTDESKSILGVTNLQETPVLSEQNTTPPPASNSTGPLDALSTTSASLIAGEQQTPPTTTIKPTSEQIVNGILFNIRQKSPFAPYAPVSGGINVPEEQTRRYREGPAGYVYGRNNEDAQARAEGIWTNLGKGLLRLPTATGIKIGQTVGFIEGLINPTNWGSGYLENASNNAITGVFNQLDDEMKNNWLPVYQKADAEGKGFWWRATNDMNFWTSDAVDGAAFMMSAFVPGGILAKLGLGARIAKGLSALKIGANTADVAIEGAATAENYLAKAQSIFASKIDKVNQWALSVAGESMFESTETGDNIKRALTYDENGQIKTNPLTGLPYTEQEKTEIAGSHMKSSFLSNAALLSATNAFELKWINSMLGKTEGKALVKNLKGGLTLGDDLAFNISNHGIERLLNSKVGVFTKGLGKGILMEGFVEENAQLAIQRVNERYGIEGKVSALKDHGEMFSQYFKQTKNALTGNDPEAAMSIGLGGILGGGMSAVSGMKEFSRNKIFTENAIKFYNESQQQWLKFGNIYETKTTTTKDAQGNDVTSEQIILDKNNQPIINSAKLFNIANNFSNAAGAVEAGNIEQNKLQRDILRDTAFADFVTAHIQLGIENELTYKLNAVDKTDAAQLIKMGVVLDGNSKQEIQKYKSLSESIIAQNKLLNDDIIFNTDWKGNMLEEEQARKHKMTELASQQAVYKGILADLNRDASNFNSEILKTVEGNTSLSDSFVDQINELQLKINSQRQVVEELSMGKGSAIKSAMAKTVLNQLTSQMATLKKDNSETLKTIKKGEIGFYEYEKSYRNEDANKAITLNYYLKLARKGQIDNHIKQIGLEWAKYADTKNGMKNFKEYIDNVITNPINEALERAERGKSAKITEEQRKERAKNRTPKDYESRTPWVKKGTNATFLYRFKDDNRIAEDIMEYYDTQDGETVSLAPMIQKIINNPYTDPYLKSILEKLLPKIKADAKVKFDMKQTYAPGYYEVGTGTITIDPALHETKMSFEGVMLHEIMHLLTSDELQYGNSKFTKDIEQIYEYTKKNLEDRGIDPSYYGFTNIHEFIAEAYSNPEFQKELNEIPGKTGAKSTWAEFMDALSAFFTKVFKLDIKPSALDDIFFKVEEYLDEDVLKEAKKQLKDNGLTDEEISRYSNHELIDMALNEGYITNDFITKSLKKNEPTPPPVPVQTPTTNINQDIEYSYNGKKYGIFVLGDEVHLLNPTDTEDSMTLTEAQFKDLMSKGQIKPFKEAQTGVAPTLEEHLQKVYNQAKTAADASNRTIASYEDWKKTAGKFEAQRYEKLVNPPKPVETKTPTELEAKKADIERRRQEELDKYKSGDITVAGVKAINAKYDAELAALEKPEEEKTNYAEQIKVNNEFAEPDGTTYKIASIIPGKTVSYIKTTPEGTSSVEKEPIDSFTKKLEDGAVTLQQTAFVGEDDTKNNVKDFVQNNRFNTSGLNSTSEDNNTANVSFQEGRKQIAPHNSLANTTDLIEEQVVGNQVRYIRVGVNNNYVFDIATGNFMPGSSVTYKVRTDDFEAVKNRITGETYDKSKVFDSNGKIIPEMFDYAPIGIYSIIDGKETLIGNLHEPQWIEYKIGDKYPNIVIPESELDQAVPATLKKELEKNRKLRNFILENHNKDSKFEMNAVVEGKSIGIIRTVAQAGTISERVNPKISEGGTSNKHGMFAIVRNGQLEVTKNVTIDGIENTKSFSEDIDDHSGTPVLLVPTPTGTFFPTFIKIPTVNINQASFILESWKAFTGQQDNPELVKAVYNAMGMQMSEGKPDIGVLQSYIDHYITILESDSLSAIGNGTDLPNNVARLNITNDGHLYIQSKLADQWYDNGGKPIVLADQLPDNVMAHLQNLLTTVKFAKGRNLKGINSIEKIPFVSIENGKMKISSMTYNEYIMQGASTYIEKGIESKNKNNDWVYFANPVIKMTTDTQGTENKIDSQKVEAVVEDKFEEAPPVASAETIEKTKIEKQINDIKGSSLGFSSKVIPGTSKWTEDGTKVTFIKSQRDKFNRGNEIFEVTRPNGSKFEVLVDYRQRPTSGFGSEKEIPFQAEYSENPKALFDQINNLQTATTEVNADDLFDMLDRAATANEMTDKQIEEQKKKC